MKKIPKTLSILALFEPLLNFTQFLLFSALLPDVPDVHSIEFTLSNNLHKTEVNIFFKGLVEEQGTL